VVTAHVVRVGGIWLDGDDLADVTTALEFQVNVLRRNPDGAPVARRLLVLLDSLREARAVSCAAQLAQLANVAGSSESIPTDLITAKEAAKLMGCSEANIRSRADRGSLWSMKDGTQWRLSRANVLEHMAAARNARKAG
jgi:excisionase family DNA binding protein